MLPSLETNVVLSLSLYRKGHEVLFLLDSTLLFQKVDILVYHRMNAPKQQETSRQYERVKEKDVWEVERKTRRKKQACAKLWHRVEKHSWNPDRVVRNKGWDREREGGVERGERWKVNHCHMWSVGLTSGLLRVALHMSSCCVSVSHRGSLPHSLFGHSLPPSSRLCLLPVFFIRLSTVTFGLVSS